MFITNATLLTDRIYEVLEKLTISGFAVSLDAASEPSFDLLRVRGRNATWQAVMENLKRLSELKQRKGFSLTLSMTVNRVNCHELRISSTWHWSMTASRSFSWFRIPFRPSTSKNPTWFSTTNSCRTCLRKLSAHWSKSGRPAWTMQRFT